MMRCTVAAAVLTQQDVLLSWNFEHLVNRHRRAQINEGNISLGSRSWLRRKYEEV
jgi:hypothetical protein